MTTTRDLRAAERILAGVKQAKRSVHVAFRAFTRTHGLTLGQVFLLRTVAHAERAMTLGELAAELDLAKSTASVEVARLVEAGYLVREVDPGNRRRVRIYLSPSGRSLLEAGPAQVTERIADALASVSEEELALIEQGLMRLNRLLAHLAEPERSRRNNG